jgi:peptidoglycan/LPS O-acetylase OafA/YrhL
LSTTRHFAALDGLRGVAALAVLTLHVLDPFQLGYLPVHAPLAVDFFFALSGFVIAHAYEDRLRAGMPFFQFARIRMIRLYPLVVVGLIFGLAVLSARAIGQGDIDFGVRSAGAMAAGLFMMPSPFLLGPGNMSAYPLNTPMWSLFVELAINATYALTIRHLGPRMLTLAIVVGGALMIWLSLTPGALADAENWSTLYRGFGKVLFSFAAGVALSRLWRSGKLAWARLPAPLLFVVLTAILMTVNPPWPDFYNLAAIVLVFPVLVAAGANAELHGWVRKVALFAGELSYPVYILHYPFVRAFSGAARLLKLEGPALYALLCFEVVVAVLASYLVMKLIDRPLRRMLGRPAAQVA